MQMFFWMRQFFFLFLVVCCLYSRAQTPKLVLPEGNTREVMINKFSPDGTMLLTAGDDDRVCLWNVATGQLLSTLRNSYGTRMAGFLGDGKSYYALDNDYRLQIRDLVSGATRIIDFSISKAWISINEAAQMYAVQQDKETLLVYSLTDEKQLFTFKGKFGEFNENKFTPDGRYLVASSSDSSILFWDVQTGRLAYHIPALAPSFTLSRDGKRIFTYDDSVAAVWDVPTGKRVCKLDSFENFGDAADFSPDGLLLVTDHSLHSQVWDAVTGKLKSVYEHNKAGKSVVFTPDGKQVITSFHSSLLFFKGHSSVLWDAATGKQLNVLDNCGGKLSAANFSKNGLFAGGGFEQSSIWELSPLKRKRLLQGRINAIREVRFTSNAQKAIVTTIGGSMQVWDVAKGKLMHTRKCPKVETTPIVLAPDNNTALFYWNDSAVQIFDLRTGAVKELPEPRNAEIQSPVFSSDGGRVAIVRSNDSMLRVWDVQQQQLLYQFKLKKSWAAVAFSTDQRFIAFTYADTIVRICDAATGKLLARLNGIEEPVTQLLFTPNGSRLLMSGNYGGVGIYSVAGWKKVMTIHMEARFPAIMDISPNSEKVLLYNIERRAVVHDVVTGKQLCELFDDLNLGSWSYFSTDSKRVYLQHSENNVSEYDCETGKQLRIIESPGYYLREFHPQAGLMVGMSNGEARLVRMADGKPLYNFFGFDGEEYLVMDEQGRFDGSDAAKKLLYMTCGTEVISLEQVKDLLYVPHLAERIMQGETINSVGLDSIAICRQVPLVSAPVITDSSYLFTITPQQGGLGDVALVVNALELQRYKKESLQQRGNSYVLQVNKQLVQSVFKSDAINEVRINAYTASNNLYSRGAPAAEEPTVTSKEPPRVFAVFIGVSDYKGEKLDLGFAAKDADDLGRVFGATAQKLLNTKPGEEHVFVYRLNTGTNRSGYPDKNSIRKTFEEIGSKAGPNDILLVFFAGHGVMQGQKQQFYFLTADAGPDQTDDELQQTGISSNELMDWIQPLRVKAQKRILIFDACNSGQALKDIVNIGAPGQQMIAARNDDEGKRIKVIEKLNERSGFFIFSASASSQSAYEYEPFKQGLLTYSLLKTIKENPSILDGGQYLDLSKWLNASKNLLEVVAQQLNRKQDPQLNSAASIYVGVVDEEVRKQIQLPEQLPLFGRSEMRNIALRVDNLNLRSTMDAALGGARELLFDKQYEGEDVYSLSGDYTVVNGAIRLTVLLLKGGTNVVMEIKETGSVNDLNALCRKVMEKVLKKVEVR